MIMRSRVRFPVLPWKYLLEGEDSHGDHGLGSLDLRFKAPPGTVLHIHTSPPTSRTSEVGYTSATTEREDHEVHKGHVVALAKKIFDH
jgi:hypothetical protein